MQLKLYHRLCKKLLGEFNDALQAGDSEYQRLVESYAGPAQTGLDQEINQKIRGWIEWYNRLQNSRFCLRYYQILALYFTEHMLRCWGKARRAPKDNRALVYWMATGSGKTLLMHLNILQFIEQIGGIYGFDNLQIILTTPGVNLIQQHEHELGKFLQKLNHICNNRIQWIIDTTAALINKETGFFNLPERHGHYRLILVDEGHIGLAGGTKELGAFKNLRQELLEPANSFLFEYSATYHGIADRHVQEYEEQIVFDYNYYRFFKDGYGKDFAIQSIKDDRFADPGREEYNNFMATFSCLNKKIKDYKELCQTKTRIWSKGSFPNRPLLAFMGNTVVDPAKEGQEDEVSDIRKLLRFLALLRQEEREGLQEVFNGQIEGKLRLSRKPGVQDLIWLSWGEGSFWGLINVGNGDKFVADCEGHEQLKDNQGNMLLEFAKASIIREDYAFEKIDTIKSPINVLIGSRKFAEGWNCFRVSVIGLINLGAGKGNKIIQIFGRGVRLHGNNGDGKRRYFEHIQDYNEIAEDQSPSTRIRRLETLNVYSLKKSYLEIFLKGLEEDLPVQFDYNLYLEPRPVTVQGQSLPFEDYSPKLKAPKVGKKTFQSTLRITWNQNDTNWTWAFWEQDKEQSQTINHFPINLDYRPNQEAPRRIEYELYSWLEEHRPFLPEKRLQKRMIIWQQQQNVQFLVKQDDGQPRQIDIYDLLTWVEKILYLASPWDRSFKAVLLLLEQVQTDVLHKVRNIVVNDINKRNYRLDEGIEQAGETRQGDFAQRQALHFYSKEEPDFEDIKRRIGKALNHKQEQLRLDAMEPKANFHIFGPLFDERLKQALNDENLLNMQDASPKLLNMGESKFVRDLSAYLHRPEAQETRHEFYLMRNEASMRSVGIYLETELQAFFPDFVLWIVNNETACTTIALVDPKGQTGIIDYKTLKTNEKVNIACNGHLDELAKSLTARHKRTFRVFSFILLRDSSEFGSFSGPEPNQEETQLIREMQAKNVLRLDWSQKKEDGSATDGLINGQSYLDMMFEKMGIIFM